MGKRCHYEYQRAMTDLYHSNRTQAEKYFQKVQASLDPLIQIEALPTFDPEKPQPFYLEFKKKIAPWIEQENIDHSIQQWDRTNFIAIIFLHKLQQLK